MQQGPEENHEEIEDDEEDDVDQSDDENLIESGVAPTNKWSPIWKHFTEIVAADGRKYAKCIHSPCRA